MTIMTFGGTYSKKEIYIRYKEGVKRFWGIVIV